MIINTLCKERKPQKVIAQKAVCSEYIHEKIIKPKRQMTTDFCGLSRIWECFISSRVRNIKSCHTQVSWRKVLHHHSPESEAALLKLHYCFSLVIWDATSSAGAFITSRVNTACTRVFRALHVSIFWQVLWKWKFLLSSRSRHLPTAPKSLPNASLTKLLLCLISPSFVCGVRKMRNTQP